MTKDDLILIAPITLVFIILMSMNLYLMSRAGSPIVETFNDEIADKKLSHSIIMVDMLPLTTTNYHITLKSGPQISVTGEQYNALKVGDIVLVGIRKNGDLTIV